MNNNRQDKRAVRQEFAGQTGNMDRPMPLTLRQFRSCMKPVEAVGWFGLIMLLLVGLMTIFPPTLSADGLIVVPSPWPRPDPRPAPPPSPFPLEVKYHRVTVSIVDQVAITTVDQIFFNPTAMRLEGYYLFPVPKGAVLKDFSMEINGKQVNAELLDANKARSIYEDIVRQMRDPALLEYSEQALFKVRIYPIEPRQDKHIVLSYRQMLTEDFGVLEYLYPLNTEKFSAQPIQDVSISVNIDGSRPLGVINCPTHQIDIVRKGETRATVSFEVQQAKPDRDFRLFIGRAASPVAMTLLSSQQGKDDGFFMLTLSPTFSTEQKSPLAKDIVFVIDVSGSMAGKKLEQAQRALGYCVENLNREDRFDIIRFSTEASSLFQSLVVADRDNILKARDYIAGFRAVGGTNIDDAMALALGYAQSDNRPRVVMFLTDGKPTIGETDEERLLGRIVEKAGSTTRIFTFGIGHDINTHFLDKVTEQTRATRTYITPDEDIEVIISNFYDRIQSPVMTDISLTAGGGVSIQQQYPREIPDLFRGGTVTLLGRYRGAGSVQLVLRGYIAGKHQEFRENVTFVTQNNSQEFIAPLWAARRISVLLDTLRQRGNEKELIDEVTELARQYGIVTPYTSYLILEDEQVRITRNELPPSYQTLTAMPAIDKEKRDHFRKSYGEMSEKSGAGSVAASRSLQQMADADALDSPVETASQIMFKDEKGRLQHMSQQIKQVAGRSFYQTGQSWVDSALQSMKPRKTERVQFASAGYFELLARKPVLSPIVALGQSVSFIHDGIHYEIYP